MISCQFRTVVTSCGRHVLKSTGNSTVFFQQLVRDNKFQSSTLPTRRCPFDFPHRVFFSTRRHCEISNADSFRQMMVYVRLITLCSYPYWDHPRISKGFSSGLDETKLVPSTAFTAWPDVADRLIDALGAAFSVQDVLLDKSMMNTW